MRIIIHLSIFTVLLQIGRTDVCPTVLAKISKPCATPLVANTKYELQLSGHQTCTYPVQTIDLTYKTLTGTINVDVNSVVNIKYDPEEDAQQKLKIGE